MPNQKKKKKKGSVRDLILCIDFLSPCFADSSISAENREEFQGFISRIKRKIIVWWQMWVPSWSETVNSREDSTTDPSQRNNRIKSQVRNDKLTVLTQQAIR